MYLLTHDEQMRLTHQFEILRQKVNEIGKWHFKKHDSDSDAAYLWKHIFNEINKISSCPNTKFLKMPFITIEISLNTQRFIVKTFKSSHTVFKGFVISSDFKKTIDELNQVLLHYNLKFVEESDEESKHFKIFNNHTKKLYVIKFVETQ